MSLSTLSSSIHFQQLSRRPLITSQTSLVAGDLLASPAASLVLYGHAGNFCHKFQGLKLWFLKNLKIKLCNRKYGQENKLKKSKVLDSNRLADSSRIIASCEDQVQDESDPIDETRNISLPEGSSTSNSSPIVTPLDGSSNVIQTHSFGFGLKEAEVPSLSIAIIGATSDLSRRKIFPALFALYYSGFLPENVRIFGYSQENMTDGDLRSLIASTLTCRVDHQENCGSKIDSFLSKTCYVYGAYDNQEGIMKLNTRMEQIEGERGSNRIFYLSVPQEAVLDVASCIADKCQTKKGWNRVIIEKPFGINALSSNVLTDYLLFKFEEKQIYRMDHLLGRNLIENLTVLRFSNLVFEPLWSRKYVRNVQVIISEELNLQSQSRYSDNYGVIRDMVHSHVLQMVALLAMETPISLDGEDIRNEKVKVLRSIGKLQPSDVILGQYKARSEDKIDVSVTSRTPTFFAAALYINNARWDGVPFLIRAGTGLLEHRMEIRIQFDYVPGNIYRGRMGPNIDLATNELILRDVPDEAILIRVNNKVPGLSLHLDASELNLLYKDKYNVEVPDSYEHLILDVIDGDNHLFMRSDELAAAWDILTPVLEEIDKNVCPELYDLGGEGPVGAYYLWAKHGVRWIED